MKIIQWGYQLARKMLKESGHTKLVKYQNFPGMAKEETMFMILM